MYCVIRGGAQIVVGRVFRLIEQRLCRCDNYLLNMKCIGGGSGYEWEDVPLKSAYT